MRPGTYGERYQCLLSLNIAHRPAIERRITIRIAGAKLYGRRGVAATEGRGEGAAWRW